MAKLKKKIQKMLKYNNAKNWNNNINSNWQQVHTGRSHQFEVQVETIDKKRKKKKWKNVLNT